MPEFEMILRGAKIPEKKAPLDVLGRFIWSLQAAMESIAHSILTVPKDPEKRKQFHKDIQLYFKGIRGGESVIVDIGTENQAVLPIPAKDKTRAEKSVDALFGSIDAIQNDNEEVGRELYSNIIPRPPDRVRVLGSIRPLWIEKDVEAIFRPKFTSPKSEYRINMSYKSRVDKWLRLEPGIEVGGFTGLITELKARGDRRYFVMQDEMGNSVKCFYPAGLETEIIAVFKTPVRVEVELTRKTQRQLIGDIGGVEKMETITFTGLDYPALIEPIELSVSYDTVNEFWVAEQPDLALRLVADTLNGLREEFKIQIDYLVDVYLIQKKGPVTKQFQKALDLLATKLDINKRPEQEHWVEDED